MGCQYRHYNHTSTSINEGSHGTLKRLIAQHNGSISYALEYFNDYILLQTKQIERKGETDMSRAPSYSLNPVFDQLRKKVSAYSLKEFHKQYQWSRGRDLVACTGTYTTVWGIPCAHVIIARGNHPITPRDFDSHWLLNPAAILVEAVAKNPVLEKINDSS
ncbi:hypothetical protein BG000_007341, partial [Podila horticola]